MVIVGKYNFLQEPRANFISSASFVYMYIYYMLGGALNARGMACVVFTRSLLIIKRLYETVKRRRRSAQAKAKSVETVRRRKSGTRGRPVDTQPSVSPLTCG